MDHPPISLPQPLMDWAQTRVVDGGYSSASDYVGDLVRRDRDAQEKLRLLQAAIDEGRASGISEHDPFEYLDELRASLRNSAGSADAA